MTYLKEGETPIPAHMFFNFKTKADGSFDKIKARIVANGDEQDVDTIVTLGLHLTSHDIKAAFLLTPVKEDVRLFVVIRGDLANLWLDVHPEYAEFVTPRGEIVFRLLQYIYGLAESPHQFHEFLTKKLISSGYKPLRGDPCLLISDTPNHEGKYSYVAVHNSANFLLNVTVISHISGLTSIMIVNGESYTLTKLAMHQRFSIEVASKTAHDDPDPQPLTKQETKDYRSLVMAIMFLARMARPDLLFTTTVLATHCNGPTQKNMCE
eukprot:gene30744-34944_t